MLFNAILRKLSLLPGILLGAAALFADAPPDVEALQKKSYALARQATLEKNSVGTLKAWLLAQALTEQGYPFPDPRSFHRLIWLSLDRENLCPDLAPELDDLGLWSLIYYNFAVKRYRASSQSTGTLSPLVPGQDSIRMVNLESSLSLAEWKSLKVFRSECRLQERLANDDKTLPARARSLVVLESLLKQAQKTVRPEVEGRPLIDARLEQVQLALARETKQPPPSSPTKNLEKLSHQDWARLDLATAAELFPAWQKAHKEQEGQERALAIVDQVIELRQSDKLKFWIAQASPMEKRDLRAAIWSGERGAKLLTQDRFSERAVVALYRGVDQLETNRLEDAFRSLALARKFASVSRQRKDIEWHLGNWLKYAAIRYQVSDELLKYLIAYLEPEDLREILKQMVWQAAFHGDAALNKLFQLPQLPMDLRKNQPYFEALKRGQLATVRSASSMERGQFLRFVREYGKQLEFVSFGILLKQQSTLVRLEQSLRQDKDPQWKIVRNESLEQMGRLMQALRSQDGRAQGRRDRQTTPQALGSSVLPPERPNLWPFSTDVMDTALPQVLGLTMELDEAGNERWRIYQIQDGEQE
jgi:hypothetical protein